MSIATGSHETAREGAQSARPNIKNAPSSKSAPTATATPVIMIPIPTAVVSIIFCFHLPSATRFKGCGSRVFRLDRRSAAAEQVKHHHRKTAESIRRRHRRAAPEATEPAEQPDCPKRHSLQVLTPTVTRAHRHLSQLRFTFQIVRLLSLGICAVLDIHENRWRGHRGSRSTARTGLTIMALMLNQSSVLKGLTRCAVSKDS